MSSRNFKLEILPPEPVDVTVSIEDSGGAILSRTIKLKPFALRDQKWYAEKFGDTDVINEAAENGEYKFLLEAFMRQVDGYGLTWLRDSLGVDTDEAVIERLLDSRYVSSMAIGLIEVLVALRSKSEPTPPEDSKIDDKKKLGNTLLTNWRPVFVGIMVGVLKTLLILRWDNFTNYISSLV